MAKIYVCDKCGRQETYYFLNPVEVFLKDYELCYQCKGKFEALTTRFIDAGANEFSAMV